MQRSDARTLTRYNAWANEFIFAAVAALPEGEAVKPRRSVFRNMVHTLNHNYVIDRIFQAHLEGRSHAYSARNTPDHPPLAELWRAQEDLDHWYIDWSDRIADAALGEKVKFTFVGGGEGAMTRGEMLQHLVNHTSYHRGFVAQMMYEVPARPPTTDLTVFLRDVHRPLAP
ncbi:MAG TPA: DinB family protein [Burkholderiales bacterium]|nr:DinB family protein [Burkholderiales bacterium]